MRFSFYLMEKKFKSLTVHAPSPPLHDNVSPYRITKQWKNIGQLDSEA